MSKARNISALSTVEVGATADQTKADLNSIGVSGGRKNLIINGGFDVWQRGTSFTPTVYDYTADRWLCNGNPTSVTKSSNGLTFVTDGDEGMGQRIELLGNNFTTGQTYTISFYATCSVANLYVNGTYRNGNSYAASAFNTATVTSQVVVGSEVKITATLTILSSQDVATQNTLQIAINSAVANTITIRDVQLELGSVATDFEHRSYGEELALCQRYYQLNASSFGQASTSTNATYALIMFTPMRANPSATVVATTNKILHVGVAYRNAVSVQAIELPNHNGGTINITMSGSSNGASHIMTGGTVAYSAEL